jgi:hypothetical protein
MRPLPCSANEWGWEVGDLATVHQIKRQPRYSFQWKNRLIGPCTLSLALPNRDPVAETWTSAWHCQAELSQGPVRMDRFLGKVIIS